MKVLIVSSNFPPDVGGPAVSANYLAKELLEKNVQVNVLTNGTDRKIKDPSYVVRTKTVKIGKKSIIGAFLRIILLFIKIIKIGKKYDIIFSQDTNISGLPVYLSSFFSKKPYVVKFSGDLAVEYLYNNQRLSDIINDKSVSARVLHWIQKVICNKSKTAIATSLYNKEYMKKIGVLEEKIKLLPNGVIKQEIDNSIVKSVRRKYEKNLLCTSSRLVKWKNVSFLIKAMELLHDYKLIIYGDGPQEQELKMLAKDMNLKNVIFYGAVPYDRIQSYIKACDYFALASSYEPFGIAILDALIVNVPVIVSNVGGMPEIAANNGLVFKENDIKDFTKKLRMLKKVKINNIKKYEYKNLIKKYLKVFE